MKNADKPAMPVSVDMAYHVQENPALLGAGMTKHERFKMAAMQGLLSKGGYQTWEDLAADCHAIADAMLKEPEK